MNIAILVKLVNIFWQFGKSIFFPKDTLNVPKFCIYIQQNYCSSFFASLHHRLKLSTIQQAKFNDIPCFSAIPNSNDRFLLRSISICILSNILSKHTCCIYVTCLFSERYWGHSHCIHTDFFRWVSRSITHGFGIFMNNHHVDNFEIHPWNTKNTWSFADIKITMIIVFKVDDFAK